MTKPLLATLLCAVLSIQPASAQDDSDPVEPRPSIMAPLAAEALLIDAVALDDYVVAVGAFGHILRIDAGLAWAQSPSPVSAQLTAIDFVDDKRGWVVGHDAAILVTDDGGITWTLQHFAPEFEQPLFDVRFIDESRGFAVGAYGLMLRTDDGGEQWDEVEYADAELADSHLNAVVQVDDALVVVGERGSVYRSPDLGDTWEVVDFPYDGSMFGAVVTQSGRVIAFGLRGHVFASDDQGESWNEVPLDGAVSLNGGRVLSDGRIVLVGMSGVVLVSDDDGETFTRLREPGGDALAGVFEFEDGGVVLIGESGFRRFTLP